MKTSLENELRRVFGNDLVVKNTKYFGNACYGDIDKDLRLKAQMATSGISSQYTNISLSVIKRTDGIVDTSRIYFEDVLGVKPVANPNFKNGIKPHIWICDGKTEWYVYKPTEKDISMLRSAVKDYVGIFKEHDLERTRKPSIRQQIKGEKSAAAEPKEPKIPKKEDISI